MVDVNLQFIFTLLIIYQLKHLLADFPLQGTFMLGKFKPGWDFLLPLLAHVGVHGGMTLAICLYFAPHLWWLALVDAGIHFTMDRLKAGPKYLGRFKPLTGAEYVEVVETMEKYSPSAFTVYRPAKRKLWGNVLFWNAIGFDALVHHCTHYFIIYMIVIA